LSHLESFWDTPKIWNIAENTVSMLVPPRILGANLAPLNRNLMMILLYLV
jgi:hypothetical protein